MDLLCLLAGEPGRVWTREQLLSALWPGIVVGEDSLARTVSKLRQVLDDDARAPQWIETIAKRGYRWIGSSAPEVGSATTRQTPESAAPEQMSRPVGSSMPWTRRRLLIVGGIGLLTLAAVWIAFDRLQPTPVSPAVAPVTDSTQWLARADDYYFRFSRADNEAAIDLYQRVLSRDPDEAAALAGLANALAQRSIRWPTSKAPEAVEYTRLGDARLAGHLTREPAVSQLRRARQLAEAAISHDPESAMAHKALGLVVSAEGDLEAGIKAHRRAIELDPTAWAAMINLADVLEMTGRSAEALPWFERAYGVMDADYAHNPTQVHRWQEALGVLIADRHRARGDLAAAEAGYRRVLMIAPLHVGATRGLAEVLHEGGDLQAAERLCDELAERLGPSAGTCEPTP